MQLNRPRAYHCRLRFKRGKKKKSNGGVVGRGDDVGGLKRGEWHLWHSNTRLMRFLLKNLPSRSHLVGFIIYFYNFFLGWKTIWRERMWRSRGQRTKYRFQICPRIFYGCRYVWRKRTGEHFWWIAFNYVRNQINFHIFRPSHLSPSFNVVSMGPGNAKK